MNSQVREATERWHL